MAYRIFMGLTMAIAFVMPAFADWVGFYGPSSSSVSPFYVVSLPEFGAGGCYAQPPTTGAKEIEVRQGQTIYVDFAVPTVDHIVRECEGAYSYKVGLAFWSGGYLVSGQLETLIHIDDSQTETRRTVRWQNDTVTAQYFDHYCNRRTSSDGGVLNCALPETAPAEVSQFPKYATVITLREGF